MGLLYLNVAYYHTLPLSEKIKMNGLQLPLQICPFLTTPIYSRNIEEVSFFYKIEGVRL
jgi:hypothetical protein